MAEIQAKGGGAAPVRFGRTVALVEAANTLNVLGDTILTLLLAVWTKALTGSNGQAGLVFVELIIPSVLAPLAGTVIDRQPKRRVLVVTNVVTIACLLPLLLVTTTRGASLILVAAGFYGFALVVFQGARTALVAEVVPQNRWATINAVPRTSR